MPKRSMCLLLSALASLQGCGAILFPTIQEVPVECPNVATASFRVPSAGTSARSGAALKLDRRNDYTVEVQAPGHATQTVRVQSELSISRAIASIVLNGSVIGNDASLRGKSNSVNIGDNTEIDFNS